LEELRKDVMEERAKLLKIVHRLQSEWQYVGCLVRKISAFCSLTLNPDGDPPN
jgi:hypothetical protein